MRLLYRIYWKLILFLSMPIIFAEYFDRETGKEYNIGFFAKFCLVLKMMRNNKTIISSSTFLKHLLMATRILNIPSAINGAVVECGCYKGGSTANLSLVCALSRRKLEVFDSFEGLPQPSCQDRSHTVLDSNALHTYSKGAYRGSINEVKKNIATYGNIDVCNFNVGFFEDTLSKFKKECVFVFADVDLKDSLVACLKHLWPLMKDGSYFFTHEAPHKEIASLFFDRHWWKDSFGCDYPGLVGAGSGLGVTPARGGFRSSIGYTVKNQAFLNLREVPQIGVDPVKHKGNGK